MNYLSKWVNSKLGINPSTLTGAIDVLIVEQEDGTFVSSPFHVRFGKMGVLRPAEKVVEIEINDEPVPLTMKLGEEGEAFFLESASEDEEVPSYLCASPIASSSDLSALNGASAIRSTERSERERERDRETIRSGGQPAIESVGGINGSALEAAMRSKSMDDIVTMADGASQSASEGDQIEWRWGQVPRPLSTAETEAARKLAASIDDNTNFSEEAPNSALGQARKLSEANANVKSDAVQRKDSQVTTETSKILGSQKTSWWKKWSSTTSPSSQETNASTASAQASAVDVSSSVAIPVDGNGGADDTQTGVLGSSLPPALERSGLSAESSRQKHTSARDEIYLDELDDEKAKVFLYNVHAPSVAKVDTSNAETVTSGVSTDAELSDIESKTRLRRTADSSSDDESGRDSACSGPASTVHSPTSNRDYYSHSQLKQNCNLDLSDFAVALCKTPISGASDVAPGDFEAGRIGSLNEFLSQATTLLADDRLVVRLGGRYLSWSSAAPLLVARLAFADTLSPDANALARFLDLGQAQTQTHSHSQTLAQPQNAAVMESPNSKQNGQRKNWFSSWKRSTTSKQPPAVENKDKDASANQLVNNADADSVNAPSPSNAGATRRHTRTRLNSNSVKRDALVDHDGIMSDADACMSDSEVLERSRSTSGERRLSECESPQSNAEKTAKQEKPTSDLFRKLPSRCKKTLRLDSSQIGQLNLRRGANKVTYSVTTQFQGTARCVCYAYLWRFDDKVVISDIDGTITKSDALGQVLPRLPLIGSDWAQPGVAQLFTHIAANGYRIAYLSARAIGMSALTREYLRSVKQGAYTLPDGPVLLSPSSLLHAFHREVIERRPEIFKIECLRDIQQVFGAQYVPLYAGFGNRVNDVFAYTAVGMHRTRIFTVNTRSQVVQESMSQRVIPGYTKLCELVDHVFPPLVDDELDESERHVAVASVVADANSNSKAVQDASVATDQEITEEESMAGGVNDHVSLTIDDADAAIDKDMLSMAASRRRDRQRAREQLDAALEFNQVVYWRDPLPSLDSLSQS